MKSFFALFTAGFREFYRDRAALFFTLAFPLMFILLFGLFFGQQGTDRYATAKTFRQGPDIRLNTVKLVAK